MPLLSSLFRSAPRPRPVQRASVWRKNEFTAVSVGEDTQAIMLRGKVPLVMPGFVVDFINSCEEFGPMEAHVSAYAEKHAWGSLECDSLRSWLPKVIEAGALLTADDLLRACQQKGLAETKPARIETIGFPTGGDRVDLVERALRSFHENVRQHGRDVDFCVADSSADPAHRDAFRIRLRELASELAVTIRYSGEEERRHFAAALVAKGAEPDAVEFALFDPLGIGFACGANRNVLLLDQVDRAFCSIDDDVICQLSVAPPVEAELKFFSQCDPFVRWLFPDRPAALKHTPIVDADFLASHEALLGKELAEVCREVQVQELDVAQVNDEFVQRALRGDGQVRATFSGHLGDPGIPTSAYFLFFEGENRQRLTASEAHYRSVLGSRSVFALAPTAAIGDSSTSPGMAMGLDHRTLLPPFFPVLHAEDFIYGAVLWQSVGNAFLGHIPVSVRHEPRPGKGIVQPHELTPANRAVIFEFAHLIRRIILRFSRDESSGSGERMASLGRYLADFGDQPLADFCEFIRLHVLEHESGKLDHLEEQLREDTETPDFWREDLQAYLEHVRSALGHEDFDIPYDLKPDRSDAENRVLMQQLFSRYGRLLQAWPKIVDAAREVRLLGDTGSFAVYV